VSGAVTVVTSGTVDTDTVGGYTLTYTSTDASGNAGTATRTVNVTDTTDPVFTSSATFTVDENVTAIGNVTATDLDTVTFTIGATTSADIMSDVNNTPKSQLQITSSGALSFDIAPDYDLQVPDIELLETRAQYNNYNNDWNDVYTVRTESLSGYESGATMNFTATVTATSAYDTTKSTTQVITVQVRDVGGVDDDTGTGTGTGSGTGTGTGTQTGG
jgi:hypothetical protein